ncbi:hypothetical protein CHY_2092 [Carboxydothermus hydrogenoformans Z-2901]|uniref:Uncharacterized protein n=1 Tax=Carboxydothermus hydrogenoformans (strain ATCC BAA-161 / DSM 6008 / Z-2901) TaxID=246194 RepID=Q3AAC3_CARHZ|nr:hypothetical protein CHY_2092 [Carboxydothermus hydrogenoformans Z-2901]
MPGINPAFFVARFLEKKDNEKRGEVTGGWVPLSYPWILKTG